MNKNKNLYNNSELVNKLCNAYYDSKLLAGDAVLFKGLDSFESIHSNWNYNISSDSEVISSLSDATMPKVFLTTNNKWYMKNNLGEYEEYGIYENTDDLDSVTTYKGKLVILSTDGHEYKWNGEEWVDLGGGTVVYGLQGAQKVYVYNKSDEGLINISGTKYDTEFIFKKVDDTGNLQLISTYSTNDRNEYEIFLAYSLAGHPLLYDLGYFYGYRGTLSDTIELDHIYDMVFSNGNSGKFGTTMRMYVDGVLKWDKGARSPYANSGYEITIGKDNNSTVIKKWYLHSATKSYEFTPIQDEESGRWRWTSDDYDTSIISGELTAVPFDTTVPEEYPTLPVLSLSVTKPSYADFLGGQYYNGLTISVYKKKFDVANNEITEKQTTPYLSNDVTTITYWKTDYIPNANTSVYCKFSTTYHPTSGNHFMCLFGARYEWSVTGSFTGFYDRTTYGNSNLYLGCVLNGAAHDYEMILNEGDIYEMTLNAKNMRLSINNNLFQYVGTYSNPYSYALWLGANNLKGSISDVTSHAKLYEFKIFESDTLVRHYMPKSDGRFYDEITGTYATTVGTPIYGEEY